MKWKRGKFWSTPVTKLPPIFHWAQSAPTRCRNRSHCPAYSTVLGTCSLSHAQGPRSVGGTLPWLARPLGTASPSTCGLHHYPEIHSRKNSKLIYLAASALEVFSNWVLYKLTYSFIHSRWQCLLLFVMNACMCVSNRSRQWNVRISHLHRQLQQQQQLCLLSQSSVMKHCSHCLAHCHHSLPLVLYIYLVIVTHQDRVATGLWKFLKPLRKFAIFPAHGKSWIPNSVLKVLEFDWGGSWSSFLIAIMTTVWNFCLCDAKNI